MNVRIEGFGIISPVGSKGTIWDTVLQNNTPDLELIRENGMNKCVAPINTENNNIDPKFSRRMDKQVVYELIAGDESVHELPTFLTFDKEKIGIFTGSLFAQLEFGMTQIRSLINSGEQNEISMYTGVSFYYGAASGEMSLLINSKGENASICTGACSGIDCAIEGAKSIERGINELVLAIGGENLDETVISDMMPQNTDWLLFNPDSYFYSSGAVCVLLASKEKSHSNIEIISAHNTNDCDSLFQCSDNFYEILERSIGDCLSKAGISTNDIDLVIPGLNNTSNYDAVELKVLYNVFHCKTELLYTPIPLIGDMLSGSGNLKIYVASQCMQHNVIPANTIRFFNKPLLDGYRDLFNWDYKSGKIKYALIIQRDIVGGRISLMVIKNVAYEND